jgi:hypothetical protein
VELRRTGSGNSEDIPSPLSRIASISIKGQVIGSTSRSDHFGFVAQQIGSFKASGFTAATDAPIELSLATLDVTLREI